jgi:hypothetical protein
LMLPLGSLWLDIFLAQSTSYESLSIALADLSLILPKMQPHLFNYCRFTSLELPQRLLHVDLNWVSVLTFFFQA